jgi:hypothetical protein
LINGDDIHLNKIKWASVDNFAHLLKSQDAFIINTDLSSGPGIHWITLVNRNKMVHIVDSLGKNNHRQYDDIMKQQLKGYDYQFYDGYFQKIDNTMCGYFAIFVAKLINSLPDKDPFQLVESVFGRTADAGDILKLVHAFGTNGNNLDTIYGPEQGQAQEGADLDGSGVFDTISRYLKGWWYALIGTRSNFNPKSRAVIQQYGNIPIKSMVVMRRPLPRALSSIINFTQKLSGMEVKHDTLFHLMLVVELNDGSRIKIEKNQVLNVEPYVKQPLEAGLPVPLHGKPMTISSLLGKTIKAVGESRFYHYDAIKTNCQVFVFDILNSNGLMNINLKQFILQKATDLVPKWASYLAKNITDLASKVDLVTEGYGKQIQHQYKLTDDQMNKIYCEYDKHCLQNGGMSQT